MSKSSQYFGDKCGCSTQISRACLMFNVQPTKPSVPSDFYSMSYGPCKERVIHAAQETGFSNKACGKMQNVVSGASLFLLAKASLSREQIRLRTASDSHVAHLHLNDTESTQRDLISHLALMRQDPTEPSMRRCFRKHQYLVSPSGLE